MKRFQKVWKMKNFVAATFLLFIISCHQKTKETEEAKTDVPEIVKETDTKTESSEPKTDTLTPKKNETFVEADADFQQDANLKLEKLLKKFGSHFPDYYGGAFINDQGNLVINIKGNLAKGKTEVIKIIGSENVLFEARKYSHKELSDIMNYLNDFSRNPKNKPYSQNMKSWELHDMEGIIGVGLSDNSAEKIQEFRKHVTDFPGIIFYHSEGIKND